MSHDLPQRLRRAVARLEELRDRPGQGRYEKVRLDGKIDGVKLAASYLEEGTRIFSPEAEPANDALTEALAEAGRAEGGPERGRGRMITRENVTDADTTRAFGPEVLTCPDCGHGIDPHGTDPGGPCGVSACPCLLQPNGIACLLIEARVREARMYNPRPADVVEARRQWRSLTAAAVSAESMYNAMIERQRSGAGTSVAAPRLMAGPRGVQADE